MTERTCEIVVVEDQSCLYGGVQREELDVWFVVFLFVCVRESCD